MRTCRRRWWSRRRRRRRQNTSEKACGGRRREEIKLQRISRATELGLEPERLRKMEKIESTRAQTQKKGGKAKNGRHDRLRPPRCYRHNGRHMQNGRPAPYKCQTTITERGDQRHTVMFAGSPMGGGRSSVAVVVAATSIFSPSSTQKQGANTIVKEGHKVVVVEYDQNDYQNTKISISPRTTTPSFLLVQWEKLRIRLKRPLIMPTKKLVTLLVRLRKLCMIKHKNLLRKERGGANGEGAYS
ncbi:hypothetical protein SESBI_17394 [Sesbania bispinosa]|nr:hypothetical protein SESBI_17394 [Sesbania bispinosa]